MLKFAQERVGERAVDVIDAFAAKRRIVSHRAGKVFWGLVDDGLVSCEADSQGYEILKAVREHGRQRVTD